MKIVRLSKDSNLNRIAKVFKWNRFSGRGPAGTTFNRLSHGTITVSETLNATIASEHTGDFTTSWTATIAGLTASRPSMLFQFVASGGGSPTITVAGATFTFATTQNFTDLADGTYQAIFSSVDDNSNVIIYVKLMP